MANSQGTHCDVRPQQPPRPVPHLLLNTELDPAPFPPSCTTVRWSNFPAVTEGGGSSQGVLVASAAKPHLHPGLFLLGQHLITATQPADASDGVQVGRGSPRVHAQHCNPPDDRRPAAQVGVLHQHRPSACGTHGMTGCSFEECAAVQAVSHVTSAC